MKSGSDPIKKPDSESVKTTDDDNQGMDALKVLQIGAGIICLILVIGFILRNVLHII
jgi:hypothetical protein